MRFAKENVVAPMIMALVGLSTFIVVTACVDVPKRTAGIFEFSAYYVLSSILISYVVAGVIGLMCDQYKKYFLLCIDPVWVFSGTLGIILSLAPSFLLDNRLSFVTLNYRLAMVLAAGVRLSRNLADVMWEEPAIIVQDKVDGPPQIR